MRFSVHPRDVPKDAAARRLGVTRAAFDAALPNLIARGFPMPDPDTGNFDLEAINTWCDARHPHLYATIAAAGARDASLVAGERIAALRNGHRG
jgi:hypothetical protein